LRTSGGGWHDEAHPSSGNNAQHLLYWFRSLATVPRRQFKLNATMIMICAHTRPTFKHTYRVHVAYFAPEHRVRRFKTIVLRRFIGRRVFRPSTTPRWPPLIRGGYYNLIRSEPVTRRYLALETNDYRRCDCAIKRTRIRYRTFIY